MERVVDILTCGRWSRDLAEDRIRLNFDDRFRRRKRLVAASGREFLLDLPEPRILHDGDGLVLVSGTVVTVEAEEEDLLEVSSDDPSLLTRIAWHLGNRHQPVEILPACLRLRDDPVIARLLDSLGVSFHHIRAGFNPEPGAPGPRHHSMAQDPASRVAGG